jgi:hypothetical protein
MNSVDLEKMKAELLKTANEEAWDDNEGFIPDDYASGNIDDAFEGGRDAGEISMARRILKTYFGIEITK